MLGVSCCPRPYTPSVNSPFPTTVPGTHIGREFIHLGNICLVICVVCVSNRISKFQEQLFKSGRWRVGVVRRSAGPTHYACCGPFKNPAVVYLSRLDPKVSSKQEVRFFAKSNQSRGWSSPFGDPGPLRLPSAVP